MSSSDPLQPSNLFDLKGRIAVITGGATGIGLMQARGLKAAGCKVFIIGRREDVLKNAVETYKFEGYFQADVTKKDEIENVVKEMENKYGETGIDILVANAGASGPTHFGADTSFPDHSQDPNPAGGKLQKKNPKEYKEEIMKNNSFENWNDLFKINVSHILFVSIAFLPLLAKASERQKSHTSTIITTGSISAVVKQGQMHYAYNASKAAANHLTQTLAFELTSSTTANIRVNCIAPGVFHSEMTAGEIDKNNESDLTKKMPTMSTPAERPGETKDMAQTIQFLAASEFMHGQVLACDGGFTLTEP